METLLNKYFSSVSGLAWCSKLPLTKVHSVRTPEGAMEDSYPILRFGEDGEVGGGSRA